MALRIQIVSIVVTALIFGVVFELVRRRRLMERYALLWMFCSGLLLALAVWKGALLKLASAVGIYYAPSALFAIALASIMVILMHFSLAISQLVDQSKVLAQRVGILQQRVDELEAELAHREGGVDQDDEAESAAELSRR
ncbi:MAG TPA: DUF2304 domain-containing protein [Solirubrobacteraceae bacterium]|jgi:hypothetical protein|nr:DUF2304 domain-containing protein [Solirubrobacteraceae bacterium]